MARLKSGKYADITESINTMNELDIRPTIYTYKEILITLIHQHDLERFQDYFSHIDRSREVAEPLSTLYVDESLIYDLLEQCLSASEQNIFDFLLNKLTKMSPDVIKKKLFNLAMKCVTSGWHRSTIELLHLISNGQSNSHGKHWNILFQ